MIDVEDKGSIKFYEWSGVFEATCTCAHGLCRKTRTSKPGAKPGQGRPLAFLAAWLYGGRDYPNKKARFEWKPDFASRMHARQGLLPLIPGADLRLQFEREPKPNEGDEPAKVA